MQKYIINKCGIYFVPHNVIEIETVIVMNIVHEEESKGLTASFINRVINRNQRARKRETNKARYCTSARRSSTRTHIIEQHKHNTTKLACNITSTTTMASTMMT